MIIVIADDITGAAELAGIGHTYGLTTALLTLVPPTLPPVQLAVVSTDTRQQTEAEAVETIRQTCAAIAQAASVPTPASAPTPDASAEASAAGAAPSGASADGAASSSGTGFAEQRQTSTTTRSAKARSTKVAGGTATKSAAMASAPAPADTAKGPGGGPLLYKKVDSAMRGHVMAELRAVMALTPYEQAVYVPANPSRGRILRGGRYFIDGTPIEQSAFAHDPEFPITSSSVCLNFGINAQSGVRVPDAEDDADMAQIVSRALQNPTPTLLAGAADLFAALLEHLGYRRPPAPVRFGGLAARGAALIVCGSTQSTDVTQMSLVRRRRLPLVSMPRSVFEGRETAGQWYHEIQLKHLSASSLRPGWEGMVLNIPFESVQSRSLALRLRVAMSEVVARLTDRLHPAELIIEGGATASQIISRLGWSHFRITDQIAPGVVRMTCLEAPGLHLTLKPGSYAWGGLFDQGSAYGR